MKIACQSCQAKYTIADDKVLGKIVKIRCKKCSATIVINGNDAGGAAIGAAAGAGYGAPAFDYASQGGGEQWTVNVAEGDQRTMSTAELGDAYRAGVVTDETYCWKDGMGDWLPLREIDGLYAAVASSGVGAPQLSGSAFGADQDDGDEQATAIQQAPAALFAGTSPMPRPAAGAPPPAAGNGGAQVAAAAAAAARRAGPRPGPAPDLFSAAASAGGEDDVMTSVPAGGIQARPAAVDDKMTGQRNENSVLFSLSALTGGGPGGGGGPPKQSVGAATNEASGLIDIRALASNMTAQQGPPKPNRIDDIMNLAGGGAFTPSLAAPILSAPPMDPPDFSLPSGGSGGSGVAAAMNVGGASIAPSGKKTWIIAGAVGGGVLLIGLVVVIALFAGGGDKDKDKKADDTPAGSTPVAVAPSASVAPTPTPTQSAAPPAVASAAPSASASASATDDVDPSAPAFDMDSAKDALRSAAGAVQGCAQPGGPTGKGKIVVVYKHSGSVASATISDPPYAGTAVGTCVAGKFFGSHVPKFSGSSPELGKSFTIN